MKGHIRQRELFQWRAGKGVSNTLSTSLREARLTQFRNSCSTCFVLPYKQKHIEKATLLSAYLLNQPQFQLVYILLPELENLGD